MKYRELGKSGIKVSTISMGCWAIAGGRNWGEQDDRDSVAAIRAAFDCGINFFDTAEGYGDGYSEKILGRTVKDFRKEIVIASKVSPNHLHPDDVKKSCEDSLRRLKTDYLDLYYIHWPNHDIPFAETLGAMQELKKEGKIRAIACSNFGKNDLSEILKHGSIAANQLPYNLLWRAIEYEIQPICVKNNVSITCYSPIAQGLLTGKFENVEDVPAGRARTRHFSGDRPYARHNEEGAEEETFRVINKLRGIAEEAGIDLIHLALAWLHYKSGVTSVIVGARNSRQIKENAKAADIELSEDIVEELNQITSDLKHKFGKNPDMWNTGQESRYN
ncbi:MAG: aldo/keto reductase [Halanaerobiaceae bacterium]